MPDNLAFMDAAAQAELVSSGQVLPRELVDAAIERGRETQWRAERRGHEAVREGPSGCRR
jgi:hypothetical protein